MPRTTHYLNSDFDLGLRPRPRQLRHLGIARQVRELSVQALIGAGPGDAALVREEVPPEFLAYLAESGIPVPPLLRHPGVDPARRLRPFGWSAEAIELNRRHRRPSPHPTPAAIRRANARSLALDLEAELSPEGPLGVAVANPAELDAVLSGPSSAREWVIKAEHGHAALANRRVGPGPLTPADRRFVRERFAEDDRLIVEPWLRRERDWCVVFEAPFDPATFRIHETVCTRDGAPIGALFEPDGVRSCPWSEELADMAQRVASRLDGEGYFGPVCVDAFSWSDGSRSSLRRLVDLNSRLSMSDGAHRLWRGAMEDRVLYYRFFSRGKLDLPGDLTQTLTALGQRRYDRAARRGVLLASPLELGVGDETWRPAKLAVIFVAETRPKIFEAERWFRQRFEA